MEVNYIFRNSRVGYSIQTVFQTVIDAVQGHVAVRETFLPSPFASAFSILKNGIFAWRHQDRAGLNHITGDVHYLLYFLHRKNTIVTVHDIMYYYSLKGLKKKVWKWLYIDSLKRAACITFISEFARQQVFSEINLSKQRVYVIPNPVDQGFVYTPKVFNDQHPRILHIGTVERKNLLRTIEALKGIYCHLRIIGKLNKGILQLLDDFHIEYSNAVNLTHAEIIEEYRKADIVNFPSTFEGFGMPIIEGQATGRVVVTSNISPMKEVAGEGAYFVNPYSVESIREAYITILGNPSLRDKLLRKGQENIKKYQAGIIANQYLNVYEKITNKKLTL